MQNIQNRRFQDLFREEKYLALKNYLYNYLLRKRAIEKCLLPERLQWVLEIGNGISPVTTSSDRTIYSDVSIDAIRFLKDHQEKGYYFVADGMQLPFKPNIFSHAICSEVLEHIEDDLSVIKELARILRKPSGCLVITVPHRKCYFTNDDHFVKHYRRYELDEIKRKLTSMGLKPIYLQKVLGPMEKITMSVAVYLFSILQKYNLLKGKSLEREHLRAGNFFALFFKWANLFYKGFVWLDARIMPFSFSSVILIKSVVSANTKTTEHFRHDEKK
jgi:ubiquinone/menaquinone biosynthesis C-methylase UbiE